MACFSKIREIVEAFGSHVHMELQQRGVEFSQLFGKYDHLRAALLEKMPAMETSRSSAVETNGEIEADSSPSENYDGLLLSGLNSGTETQDSVSFLLFLLFYDN